MNSHGAVLEIPPKGSRGCDANKLVEGQLCVYDGDLPNVKAFSDKLHIVVVEDIITDSTGVVTSVGVRSMRSDKVFLGAAPIGYVPLVPITYHATALNPMIEVHHG